MIYKTITLTPEQEEEFGLVGLARRQASLERGLPEKSLAQTFTPERQTQINKEGGIGEGAFWLITDRRYHWPRLVNARSGYPDLLPWWEVRYCSDPYGSLAVKTTDPNHHQVVFICKVGPHTYGYGGWIMASEGKQRCWWKNMHQGSGVYWVPQAQLIPEIYVPESEV
jgi:hypothetical protein